MSAPSLSRQASIESEVLAHLLVRFGAAKAEEHPFPHFFVENVFPAGIYRDLLASQPPTQAMDPLAHKHHNADGACNRFEMMLRPLAFEAMPPAQGDLWHGVHRALSAPQVKQTVFAKLATGLSRRYGVPESDVNQVAGFPRTSLMRETEGYSIAPHPDGRRKIVTMQFALPPDDSQAELGTTFYERSLDPRAWVSSPRGFRIAKQMPFLPNCAYAFVVLNGWGLKSWHGREKISGATGTRNSLLHIYYSDPWGTHRYEQ